MNKYIAKTLYGLEPVLEKELIKLGAKEVVRANRAVVFAGDKELLYRVNYCSRTALSVLMSIAEFRIRSKDDLYRKASAIEWSEYFDPADTFSVVPVVNSNLFGHTGYPGLVVKDAIADYFRNKTGKRPSVKTTDPLILINLHISNEEVTISLDSSVIPLFKRGYRSEQGLAPLNEVLAAGILMLSGWDGRTTLMDPMCGSGTILIEAGLIAGSIPPGKFRQSFGFGKWKDFDSELFEKVRYDADSRVLPSGIRISGSDISLQAVNLARANIEKAGLSESISVEVIDFKEIKPDVPPEFLIMNPPYGLRIKSEEIDKLYNMIGSTLKHNFPGCKAWVITSEREFLKNIGLKPKVKHTLFNGALECVLAGYEMYEGSRKKNDS